MKLIRLCLSLILALAVFYLFNTKLGSIPPIGKFLDPHMGFWQNEESDPNLETLTIPGLKEAVNVYYDLHGIPHIFAQNDHDLAVAQGFITAKDRLWQMEFQTHAAAGRISEIVGEAGLNFDRGQRRKGMVFGAENAIEAMKKDPETYRLMEAYTSGVNYYIQNLESKHYPVEYKLLDYKPESWSTHKIGLLLMYMTDMLAGGDKDLEHTNFLNKYGKERFDFIYPGFFDVSDPVIPSEKDWSYINSKPPENPNIDIPKDTLSELLEKPNPDNGSNNWAIAPEKSYSGNPILANDPHLGLNLPSIWYVMQLSTPDQKAMGATLPGVLGIISGFNEFIAWGETNATRDVKDWYKITFKDEDMEFYLYDKDWIPTTKRNEKIKIKGAKTYTDTVVYTHHGPVSYDKSFGSDNPKLGYAMKWMGHVGGNNQRPFLELNKAKNYNDYKQALSYYVAPAQNFVFASTEGDIALWIQGQFPNKWPEQGKFLMDGSKSENDWQSYIPQDHNAFIKNPERGFVSSANQNPVDSTYPYYVFNSRYETYRNRVINDFFRSKDKLNIQDFKDLHNNNYNLKAAELLPYLISIIDPSSLNNAQLNTLNLAKDWNFENNIDALGASIWEAWWQNLNKLLWDEYKDESYPMEPPVAYRAIELIKNNPQDELMDIVETPEKETASDLVLESFKLAHEELESFKEKHGNYKWGAYKATYLGHLLRALPAFSRFELPIGGNRNIVNATSKNHGPSWRMIVELDTPPKALGIYPGGQSGNPGSKFYDNFVDIWAKGEYINLQFMLNEEYLDKEIKLQKLIPSQ